VDQHSGSKLEPSEEAHRATGDCPGLVGNRPKRFSARRKVEIVVRLLRGEGLELLSRELGLTVARVSPDEGLRIFLCETLCENFFPKPTKGWEICQNVETKSFAVSICCNN
jgi:hypothetical protein